MTVATFYPDADPETTSVDGGVGSPLASPFTWASNHDDTSGLGASLDDFNEADNFIESYSPTGWAYIHGRSPLLFDISKIPTSATIVSAILSLYGVSKSNTSSWSTAYNIYTSNPASNTAVVSGDFNVANWGDTKLSDNSIAYNDFSITGYNDWTLNAAGIAVLQAAIGGVAKLGFREANYDAPNIEPTPYSADKRCQVVFYTAEQGTVYRPKLVITYTSASGGGMTAVITQDTVEINGYLYRTKNRVNGAWEDPFPTQQAVGDPDYSNRRDLSSWIITSPLYIGVEEMDERVDANKVWWTDCIVQYRGHTLPPRKATSLTSPTLSTGWLSPDSTNDPGAIWANDANAIDGNTATSATYTPSTPNVYTDYLELISSQTAYSDSIRYYVNAVQGTVTIDLDAWYNGVWNDVFEGTTALAEWVTKTLSSNQWVSKIRIRLKVSIADMLYITEGQINRVTIPTPTSIIMANFNGVLYGAFDNILAKLNAGRTAWTVVKTLPATITALIPSLNSRLYIYQGNTENYYYMSTAEAFTQSNSANANWGFQYDAKLFKVNTSGTVAYSTDPDGATPTWTSGGAINDIAAQIEAFIPNGRDAAGKTVPYGATNSILKVYDDTTPQWLDTEVSLPNHPIGGKGATYYNGKVYISYGLAVKEYYAETGSLRDVGLTERDGLPIEYNGEIVKLLGDSGSKMMFAAVDASVPSGNSKSGLYAFDGYGWQCWWTSASVLVEDCEDAWNELVDADVTASLDTTDFQVGAGSAKFVCAAGLAAGDIIATEAITSTDLSGKTHISFRFKSTVALDASDLQLLLDDTASCASPLETLNLPAITANTWTKVDIALAAASSDTAIISVGLKMAVDKGAFTVNIDNIKGEDYNEAMYDIIVSSASSGYAVYWDAGGTVYYIDIPRGIENPDKITQNYATAGILITPWFDAGNPVAAKLAKALTDYAKGITTTETVALKYRIDHTYTDLDTGWTLLDTLNTTGESGYNEELFASGAGLSYKAIQFRLDFVTGGSTAKADIQPLVFYYKKRTGAEKLRVWDVTVICNDEFRTSAKEKVANLKTAIESAVDVVFAYHSDGQTNTNYYVSVNCPKFNEETGLDYPANYDLQLIES